MLKARINGKWHSIADFDGANTDADADANADGGDDVVVDVLETHIIQ